MTDDGRWHHVVIVADRASVKPQMYLNGRLLTRWRRVRMALKIERPWTRLRYKLGLEKKATITVTCDRRMGPRWWLR